MIRGRIIYDVSKNHNRDPNEGQEPRLRRAEATPHNISLRIPILKALLCHHILLELRRPSAK